jgi:hypothetical protein
MNELQGGTMTRTTKITTLIVAVATAAVFTSSASGMARADNGASGTAVEMEWVSNGNGGVKQVPALQASNIPYLSHGYGITREAPAIQQRSVEIPYLSHGVGITREVPGITTEIPYLSHGYGVTREAPQQSMPIFRDVPDGAALTRGGTVEVSLASSSSIDWSEVAMGFGFGLVLALLGAVSLLTLRQRTLRTQ